MRPENSQVGSEIPLGWSYNPSTWKERLWLVIVSMIGFLVAGYLSLFQFGLIADVWEPFFGDGSRVILNSPISHLLPIPDGALGALGYLFDGVTGAIGGVRRWRTMPWMVLLFGIAVGPLGAISILLVILQPLVFGAWCSLCLFTAVISVVLIAPSVDEVLASLQYLKRERREGRSVWRAFLGKPQQTLEPNGNVLLMPAAKRGR